ncbi:MAG: nucleoside hydrolase [Rubrobacter sp.]|jgi:inosine-uridine nucleoside N-ribohydrolase|nr:nucleoside hydrolase [Rubrobacter sp.]MDQ3378564.1 nucleoside hydrolase [Actinomycetota bacterium]
MAPIRVVLDCDTANEVDDQFAIAHALGLPEGVLDVRGVISVHNTTAHGPGSRDMYQDEAERVVSLCGGGVPCITGADRPMNSRDEPVPSSGLEFLIDEARQGPLTVVATGPATDVASLFVADPGLRENVRVVWLGGFGDAEAYGRHKSHELNGRADIAAWRVLFEEDVDLLQVPGWPAPAKILVLAAPFAEEVRAVDSPVASYLAEILELWVAEYGGPVDPGGEKILWDVACVAAVAHPESVTIERRALPTLDAAAAHDYSLPGREVDTVVDLDRGRVLRGMMEALGRHPGGPRP